MRRSSAPLFVRADEAATLNANLAALAGAEVLTSRRRRERDEAFALHLWIAAALRASRRRRRRSVSSRGAAIAATRRSRS